jgi:hypothetical protein
MSQSHSQQHANSPARQLASARVAGASVSTAAGLAAERDTLDARGRTRHTSRVMTAARRLDEAALSDANALHRRDAV